MDELSEEEISSFVESVLSGKESHPFSNNYIGLAESDLLEIVHNKLSKRFIESQVNDIFQEARKDIVSRKISTNLKELHTVTRNCNKCKISSQAELPKWNTDNPDIVVVIDSPNLPQESIGIMVESFKISGIQSQQLCLTYVNRCPVPRKYEEQEILNCASFLHSEIQILNPKLILCLGLLPSSVLFGVQNKLKDIRGHVRWLGYWPIITTYSPMYVSKSISLENENILDQFHQDIKLAKTFISKKEST